MEALCTEAVKTRIIPGLEQLLREGLGEPTRDSTHLKHHFDPATNSPVVNFLYPTINPEHGYIESTVKLEFGALTDQRPTGSHRITPWVAEDFPALFQQPTCAVIVLEAERTF